MFSIYSFIPLLNQLTPMVISPSDASVGTQTMLTSYYDEVLVYY